MRKLLLVGVMATAACGGGQTMGGDDGASADAGGNAGSDARGSGDSAGSDDAGTSVVPSGVPDTSFGPSGCRVLVYNDNVGNESQAKVLALDSSDRAVIVGTTQTDGIGGGNSSMGWLARVESSGTTTTNVALEWHSSISPPYGFALAPDSSLTLFSYRDASPAMGVVAGYHVTPSGPDGTLGQELAFTGPALISGNYQTTGRLVLLGGTSSAALTRLLATGAVDTSFGTAGSVLLATNSALHADGYDVTYAPRSLAVDAVNRIYVLGVGTKAGAPYLFVARYTADGALDTTFGSSGMVATVEPRGNGSSNVDLLAVSSSGADVYVVSRYYAVTSTHAQTAIQHITSSGLDDGFAGEGYAVLDQQNGLMPSAIAVQADGALVVTGEDEITEFGGFWYLTRVTTGGVVDTSYATNGWRQVPKDSPSMSPGESWYRPRSIAITTSGAALVVQERTYLHNLYSEANAIVCRFTP